MVNFGDSWFHLYSTLVGFFVLCLFVLSCFSWVSKVNTVKHTSHSPCFMTCTVVFIVTPHWRARHKPVYEWKHLEHGTFYRVLNTQSNNLLPTLAPPASWRILNTHLSSLTYKVGIYLHCMGSVGIYGSYGNVIICKRQRIVLASMNFKMEEAYL